MENEIMNTYARFLDQQRAMKQQNIINKYKAAGYDVTIAQQDLDYFNDLRKLRDAQSWLRRALR